MRPITSLLMLGALLVAFAGTAAAQAAASTGVQNYATAPTGNYLDEYYFDVDFGGGVAGCDLSLAIVHTAGVSMQVEILMSDPMTTLTGPAQLPTYNPAISYTNAAAGSSASAVIWGPNSVVTTPGNYPLTGVVRFDILVTVLGTGGIFPNDITVSFTTSVGTIVSNAAFPIPVGTAMGYNVWSQVTPGTAGLLGGYGRAGNCDYFQRNYSNFLFGVTRFGSATEEMQFFIDVDLGTATTTLGVGLMTFAYVQGGAATGTVITELFDMTVGYGPSVASATASTSVTGIAGAGYDSYITASLTGLLRFRVVMRGQGLTGVGYAATTLADFGFELYFSNEGQVQSVTTEPSLAAARMAITPAATAFTTSPAALSVTGGTAVSTYNWTIQGATPAGVSLSAATGATTNIVFNATTPVGSLVTVRCTNGTGPEFTQQIYTLNFGGGGGGTLTIVTTTLPNGTVGGSYAGNVTATGTAVGPFTWSVSSPSLPGGVTLGGSTTLAETLTGIPAAAGTFNFDLMISNGPVSDTQSYTVDIVAVGVLVITTTTLPAGTNGTLYAGGTINSVGGTGNHTWSLTAGVLPTGLTLGTGPGASTAVTGTPTQTGSFPLTVQVVDSSGVPQTDTQAFTLVIAAAGGPGPGPSGGNNGGGGGCVADGSSAWMLAIGLLALFGFALRMRSRRV